MFDGMDTAEASRASQSIDVRRRCVNGRRVPVVARPRWRRWQATDADAACSGLAGSVEGTVRVRRPG
jgi:hypothetical protein